MKSKPIGSALGVPKNFTGDWNNFSDVNGGLILDGRDDLQPEKTTGRTRGLLKLLNGIRSRLTPCRGYLLHENGQHIGKCFPARRIDEDVRNLRPIFVACSNREDCCDGCPWLHSVRQDATRYFAPSNALPFSQCAESNHRDCERNVAQVYNLNSESTRISCAGVNHSHKSESHPDSVVINRSPSVDNAKRCTEKPESHPSNGGNESDVLHDAKHA